jgi:iron complex transport system substrate-binding protein
MKRLIDKTVVFAMLFAALSFLAADPALLSEQKFKSSAFPLEMTDDTGSAVKLKSKPQAIVSMTLPSDEILLDLVSVSRLKAVTVFSADKDISNAVAKAAAVPNKLSMNVETILSLEPDLVILASWTDSAKVAQIRAAGISVYRFNSPSTVDGIYRLIMNLSLLTGELEKGKSMVKAMDKKFLDIENKLKGVQKKTVLDFGKWGTQGKSSSFYEMCTKAGLVNLAASVKEDAYGQIVLSNEKLIELNPDVLVLPGWIYGEPDGAKLFFDSFMKNPAYAGMRAVKTKSVIMFNEALKTSTSQYFSDAVEALAKAAYPGLF